MNPEDKTYLVYLAGGYTADEHDTTEDKLYAMTRFHSRFLDCVAYFARIENPYIQVNFFPVVPHTMNYHTVKNSTEVMHTEVPNENYFYTGTAELLKRCDAMLVLSETSRTSKGVANEMDLCFELNIPFEVCANFQADITTALYKLQGKLLSKEETKK